MRLPAFTLAALALTSASAVIAADAPTPTTHPIAGMFRMLKADGSTVVSQAIVTPGVMQQISIRSIDAIAAANGRCAFNVKIDEISQSTLAGTTTRLYSNDTLVANVTKLDLVAHTAKPFVTQPYLYAGRNNVKVVFNAESTTPTVGWVQVLVDGTCNAAPPPVVTPKPTPPALPPVKPGSGDWNLFFNAYGYSNYAVHGLKGTGYIRYDELVSVNAALIAAVKAGTIERAAYLALLARWNAINGDPDFKAAMARVVPGGDRRI